MQTNVEIIGKFYDNHSLAIVNRNIALKLKNKVNLRIVPLDFPKYENKVNPDEITSLNHLKNNNLESIDVQIRHTYPPMWRWPEQDSTKVIFIQPWEFMAIPLEWQYKFENFADLVITPSNWTAEVFRNSGLPNNRVAVIPNGYNEQIFKPDDSKKDISKIRVLFVGCSQFRKGLDVLLNVWSKSTNNNMPIELIIKDTPQVYGKSNLQQDIINLQYNTKCASIIYDDSIKNEQEMAELYQSSNILVHPYRGEGFGMHVQEAMACGCIPIVTAGGPTDEFVRDYKIQSYPRTVNMYDIFGLKPEDSMTMMGAHKYVLEPDANHLAHILNKIIPNLVNETIDTSNLNTWSEVAEMYYNAILQVKELEPKRKRLL